MKAIVLSAFAGVITLSAAGSLATQSAFAAAEDKPRVQAPSDAAAKPPVERRLKPPMPSGMVSHSVSPPAMVIQGPPMPQPPIVAIPRRPGPAELMVAGAGNELRTIERFSSVEACDKALPAARRQAPNAFCVSTAPPEPEPDHAELVEIDSRDELVGLKLFPSMAACEQARGALPARPGVRAICAKLDMH